MRRRPRLGHRRRESLQIKPADRRVLGVESWRTFISVSFSNNTNRQRGPGVACHHENGDHRAGAMRFAFRSSLGRVHPAGFPENGGVFLVGFAVWQNANVLGFVVVELCRDVRGLAAAWCLASPDRFGGVT